MAIKTILISQPQPESGKSPYIDVAAKHGAVVEFRPFIRVDALTSREFRDQKINILEHSAVIFTTRKAMEHFFGLSAELRLQIPDTMKYFCVNESIANYLQKFVVYRKRKVFFPPEGTIDALVATIHKHSKEKYFLPLPEEHKRDLIEKILTKKIELTTGIMFRTVPREFTDEEKARPFDMLILFTPTGVTSLKQNYPDLAQGEVRIATLGTQAASAVEREGYRLDLTAGSVSALIEALDQYLASQE